MARSSTTDKELADQLRELNKERAYLISQIHAGEMTFTQMPTRSKCQRLADQRHKLHLVEVDILDLEDERCDREVRRGQYERAARELQNILGDMPDPKEVLSQGT